MLPMLWPTEMRNACGNWLRFNNGGDPTLNHVTSNTLSRALISLNTFLARAFLLSHVDPVFQVIL